MGNVHHAIDGVLAQWIGAQPLFFVGTAPLAAQGHVNVSPKGLDTLRVLGPHRVAYLDLTGSGAETIAHVRENGRIVLMFCAFTGPPKIVRLHGAASVVVPRDGTWAALRAHFPDHPGVRSIVDVQVTRVSDSCGYGVPTFAGMEARSALRRWTEHKGADGVRAYRQQKNAVSVDGLPGFRAEDEAAH